MLCQIILAMTTDLKIRIADSSELDKLVRLAYPILNQSNNWAAESCKADAHSGTGKRSVVD